ncbi:mariner Mos1 transposase [Trichonephila clavipes]|nr:mariner Mos1 transposase [Trichonephila clavipes]
MLDLNRLNVSSHHTGNDCGSECFSLGQSQNHRGQDRSGPLLVKFLKRGTTINVQRYQAILLNLRRAIKSKCPCMLSNGVILLHDNAHPHMANTAKTTLQQFRWETLEHPSYSSDLSPKDFHVFRLLKRAIRENRFAMKDEVCDWAPALIRQQSTSFFKDGIAG